MSHACMQGDRIPIYVAAVEMSVENMRREAPADAFNRPLTSL